MRETILKLYTFDELSDKAKEKAREWWLRCFDGDVSWADFVINDAARMASILGINIRTRPLKLMNGSERQDPYIWWSGFSSQGDGACLEGHYAYAKGSCKEIRKAAPSDTELHRITDDLMKLQRKFSYKIRCGIVDTGSYDHSNSVHIEDQTSDISDFVLDQPSFNEVCELLRDFMNWIYYGLQKEYEYQTSYAHVDESIRLNEYEFTAEGHIA
ncbi:MAG: antitoxin of toxin-antitoxin stability system [Nitrospiraceae bacterium]